jgi:polyphenol oxidase
MKALESPALRALGISHGFGTLEEPVPAPFATTWDERPRWKQVHGIRVAQVTGAREELGEADAIFSSAAPVPVAVMTADCVPVLLARRDGGVVAAVHAGWRGTRARILDELWRVLRARGEDPAAWIAAVGPAIGPCCYEVSEELAEDFGREFGPAAVPRPRRLDLPGINADALKALGLTSAEVLRHCTLCSRDSKKSADTPVFNSYRRDGSGTRQFSVIRVRGS